jgi:4'-phosphopantetheinyl transferase
VTEALTLRRGEVLLRWFMPKEAEFHLGTWQQLLSEEENTRADRFRFAADRCSYVAAHALLRCLLGAQGVPAPRFVIGPWGRPELECGRGGLRFSLTHTRTLVAAAMTILDDLGVDAELADREAEALELAERFFAPSEAARLAALPRTALEQEFLRIWTLKEAFVKAVGLGLSLPLDRFAFGADPGEFSCAVELGPPAAWSFHSLRTTVPSGGHDGWISVALRWPTLKLNAAPVSDAKLKWLAAQHLATRA